jgi:endonuclease/exonuclease/phosphatase family metal-dependent hydrolase
MQRVMTTTAPLPVDAAAPPRRSDVGTDLFRCLTLNTHRGSGPKLDYLLRTAEPSQARRLELLHDAAAYTCWIAEWLQRRRDLYDAVGLQEVFGGVLGLGALTRFTQDDSYRFLSGYETVLSHAVGFAGFRYANMLLARGPVAAHGEIHAYLPGRIFLLAACGFTLAPLVHRGRTIWVGNTHLHSYDPKKRARQAAAIAAEVAALGDVPVVFMGDLNTTPPGCRDGDFPAGERDVRSYRGDETLKILARAGLRCVPHEDGPEYHTYPTGDRNRTLDYVLCSRHWQVEEYRVLHEVTFSDHYPVEAALRLRAGSGRDG